MSVVILQHVNALLVAVILNIVIEKPNKLCYNHMAELYSEVRHSIELLNKWKNQKQCTIK